MYWDILASMVNRESMHVGALEYSAVLRLNTAREEVVMDICVLI